ncbi:hypothetical protein AQUCO_01200002v1 [Aquilegia coerulea]|uniref:Uncharacterized protein n=1 Tax=Aquilegia coerulea TaxID=218851 RepID=A0A2G5E455_AQUCA|nr:hypothetical protein AQUCO_01200002v1 [Aquilegia coerulea]
MFFISSSFLSLRKEEGSRSNFPLQLSSSFLWSYLCILNFPRDLTSLVREMRQKIKNIHLNLVDRIHYIDIY